MTSASMDSARALVVDPALLTKYEFSGPRYTSYPTADRFTDAFRPADGLRQLARRREQALFPLWTWWLGELAVQRLRHGAPAHRPTLAPMPIVVPAKPLVAESLAESVAEAPDDMARASATTV